MLFRSHSDLAQFRSEIPQVFLLHYVYDLLLAVTTEKWCRLGTEKLLAELRELGYKASAKKAQNCQTEVTYLGYSLRERKWWLPESQSLESRVYKNQEFQHILSPALRMLGWGFELQSFSKFLSATISFP